jgi:hypothetical protein
MTKHVDPGAVDPEQDAPQATGRAGLRATGEVSSRATVKADSHATVKADARATEKVSHATATGGVESSGVKSFKNGRPTRARGAREMQARAALRPLGPHERPVPLRVAIAVAVVLALGVIASVATVGDLARNGGSLPGGILLACVLLALAWGMYQRRYWAVLGFEALLAFQIIVTSLALIVAETLLAAGLCTLSIGLAGWLFWKLVRVMGRIQAGEHVPRDA